MKFQKMLYRNVMFFIEFVILFQAKIVETLLGFEVTSVACGASHVVAITNEHEVFTWGRGDNGRLGTGSAENVCTPVAVLVPDNCKPVEAFCGSDCSVIVSLEGAMMCCGSNRWKTRTIIVSPTRC